MVADFHLQNFVRELKGHLLSRLTGREFDSDEYTEHYTDQELASIQISNSHIYRHKTMHVNYTTYDMRRDQDTINPRTHADIMVLSPEESEGDDRHPYWYARVCGIFHTYVRHVGPLSTNNEPQRMEFLWVRWYSLQDPEPGSPPPLDRLCFPPVTSPNATTFIDPDAVLRAAHLIPRFSLGRVHKDGKGLSEMAGDQSDWKEYYVNR